MREIARKSAEGAAANGDKNAKVATFMGDRGTGAAMSLQDAITTVPAYGEAIGMVIEQVAGTQLTVRLPYAEHLVGDPDTGVIHGGVITAVLDNASGWAVRVGRDWREGMSMATLDIRIDYMKPAEPRADLFVTAECFKQTKTIAFVRGIAFQGDIDDPVATSVATFMMGTPNEPRP